MRAVWMMLLFLATGTALAQDDQLFTATRQQLDVTKTVLAQEAAWNKGDMAAYLGYYKEAPDTVAMMASPARGLENIRAAFAANFPNATSMGQLEESGVSVRSMGETFALVTGTFHLMRSKKDGGPVQGTFTDVLEKTPGGWKIIFSETA